MLDKLKSWLASHAAWVSAAGLLGYALYEATAGDYAAAARSAVEALGIGGLWLALPGPLRLVVERALEDWLRSRPRALAGRYPDPHEMVLPFPPPGRPNPGV